MSLTAPYRASAQQRHTPLATPSLETPRTDRPMSVSTSRPTPGELDASTPEPHWQASIESATD